MKKKKLTWMLALIAALMTTACSNDENIPGSDGNDNGVITFTVTPDYEVKTRATLEATPDKTLRCIVEVYDESSNMVTDSRQIITVDDTYPMPPINVHIKKQPGKKFTAVFWADYTNATGAEDKRKDLYYNTSKGLDEISINSSNDTYFDGEAFYKSVAIDETGEAAETEITLKHAVAEMNIKTTSALDGLKSVTVTYGTDANAPASSFNALTGKPGAEKKAITKTNNISLSGIPTEGWPSDFHTFYVFAPEEAQDLINMSVTMCVDENGVTATKPIEIPNVPIRANYRTNIKSSFALLPTNITITCDRIYANELDAFAWNVAPDPATKFNDNNSDGTEDNPYIIATASQLAQLAANVNSGIDYKGKYFKMTADIDLGDREWTPIGTGDRPFKGQFDGEFHSITRLKISSKENIYAGLFGYCSGNPSMKNLHVSGNVFNYTSATNEDYLPIASGIIGYKLYDSGNVENCSFSGTVNCPNGRAGGIVGCLYGGKITCCKNTGDITGKQAGGIAGDNMLGIDAYYEYCYNTGHIKGTDVAVGISHSMSMGGNLNYCYNIGEIESDNRPGALITSCDVFKDFSYCKQKYKEVGKGEKEFSEINWPKTDDEGWKAGEKANGTEENGYWKSLGGWNGGVNPEYPKLWWEK